VNHAFSKPAVGRWMLSVTAFSKDWQPAPGAFYLSRPETGETLDGLEYALAKDERLELELVADLEKLGNPYEPRRYEIKILDSSGHTLEEYEFTLERSRQRTDLEVEWRDRGGKTLLIEGEETMDVAQALDLSEPRLNIHADNRLGALPLFGLTLRNRCRRGHGFADWRVLIVRTDGSGKLECPERALAVQNAVGAPLAEGRLLDSPDAASAELTVALDPRALRFNRRDADLKLELSVECDIHPDGEGKPNRRLQWRKTVRLALRDIPPKRVLAIDFGTSAIAVAHAIGDGEGDIQRLPIAADIYENRFNLLSQCLEESPNFLSADANLFQSPKDYDNPDPEIYEPDDPHYLALPAERGVVIAAMGKTEMVFPSLKMLLVNRYTHLPIDPRIYPYRRSDGGVENWNKPPLEEVLRGVFVRLRKEYAHPVLKRQGRDYFYLVATHPNTYTAVERAWLRDILVKAFEGPSDEHRLYRENIHLLSESDAVLNYYLLNAAKHRGCAWEELPEKETVLIWDIGAGTLDMSLAKVERPRDEQGALGRPRIEILDRHGVNVAGNCLTECIARDLDKWLSDNLDEAYKCRIVERPGEVIAQEINIRDQYNLMLALRNEIERYKRAIVSDGAADIQLLGSAYGAGHGELLSSSPKDREKYEKRGLRVERNGVYWKRNYDGKHVSAFMRRVAKNEVESFIGTPPKHPVDTVIVSGRTALWPKLLETLKESLPGASAWVTFNDPEILKNAVTEGAVISQTRWRENIILKAPPVFGEYVIRYEKNGKDDWTIELLPNGKAIELHLPNAYRCIIGIRQSDKRFKQLFPFEMHQFQGDRLTFTMTTNSDTGDFACAIKDESGIPRLVNQANAGQWRKPIPIDIWPLTRPRLPPRRPEDIATLESYS
jgi:hypothetical protein